MVYHNKLLQITVVFLITISMLYVSQQHSFANTVDKSVLIDDQNTETLKSELKELPVQNKSKVLLENNEDLDVIIDGHALTIDSIINSIKASPLNQKEFSNKEIEMMAKMVYGEARGESFKGKVAVAAVILNRVESPKFPNTVSKVLFQDGAFSAVNDGQFQKSPDHEAYRAVIVAINGMDPTKNAIFYYNPEIATSDWMDSRPTTAKIGEHVFSK